VSQNRSERQLLSPANTLATAEVLRQAAESSKPKDEGKEEKAMPVFWRVFGGTVLSIAALILMTAYQNLTGTIAELRNELGHLNTDLHKELGRANEAQGELVKKEEANSRLSSVWRGIKEMQDERKELDGLRERCQGLMAAFKSSEQERQRLAREVQGLREKQAAEEERRALTSEVQKLRERLAGLEGQRGGVKQADHRDKPGE
jgi:chromosome segregation ATPase